MVSTDEKSPGKGVATIPKLAFSIEEAMAATSFGRQAIYDDINSGLLIARRRGSRTIILAEDLAAYLAALPAFKAR
jgi:hypothetical protein